MAFKNKPTYFNEDMDKDILEWLKTKGNYSAYVKFILREKYISEKQGMQQFYNPSQMTKQNNEQDTQQKANNFAMNMFNKMKHSTDS